MAIDTKFAKEAYTGLPQYAKGILVVGGVALIGYIVYKLIKKTQEIQDTKDAREEQKGWESEQEKLNKDPKRKQRLSDATLKSLSNKIWTAMDGYGTDEDAIISAFKSLQTDGDFVGLQKAYGVREISSGTWNPEPNYKGSLTGGLTSELSTYWTGQVNKILSSKGIHYRV